MLQNVQFKEDICKLYLFYIYFLWIDVMKNERNESDLQLSQSAG